MAAPRFVVQLHQASRLHYDPVSSEVAVKVATVERNTNRSRPAPSG